MVAKYAFDDFWTVILIIKSLEVRDVRECAHVGRDVSKIAGSELLSGRGAGDPEARSDSTHAAVCSVMVARRSFAALRMTTMGD